MVARLLGDGLLQRRLHGATDVVALGAVHSRRLRLALLCLRVKAVTGFKRPSALMLSASSRTSCAAVFRRPGRTMILSIAIFIPASSLYNDVAGRSFPVGRTIPPLPYGENRGAKRNCFLQPQKIFFREGVRLAPRGAKSKIVSTFMMVKERKKRRSAPKNACRRKIMKSYRI